MKHLIALVVSVIVNAGALGALEWNVYVAQTPQGHVQVTQLDALSGTPILAQAAKGR